MHALILAATEAGMDDAERSVAEGDGIRVLSGREVWRRLAPDSADPAGVDFVALRDAYDAGWSAFW
jgi:hypothetical protein